MKKNNQSNTIKKYGLLILLVCVTASVFYACKKRSEETPIIPYASELKTYHESKDYKNLLVLYPNSLFQDMPIVDASTEMKAILTKIVSSSGEAVTAMTYFQPQKEQKINTWYPTIILRLKGDGSQDLKEMIRDKDLSGYLEIGTTTNATLHSVKFENNKVVSDDNFANGLSKSFVKMSGSLGAKLLVAEEGTGPGECLKQMDVCATQKMKDMGYFELASCVATAAVCIPILYADCFLHEKACLGLDKPLAE